jgi:Tol biopolymer transport system component
MWRVQGSFYMYKLGESICQFIDSAYGPEKLTLLFENWYKGKNFEEIVKVTLGDDLATLSNKWEYSLKKKYYPEIAELGLPRMESRRVVKEGFAVKGVPFRWNNGRQDADWIVFIAHRLGYSGIYMMPLGDDKGDIQTLVKGERSSTFESLHFLRSGIDAHSSGKVIFSSKSKERDVIYLYNLNKRSVTKRYEFDSLISARSPRFSSDAQNVVFSGVHTNGTSDIYILELATGALKRLTSDIYYDVDPAFSPESDKIVFASDRCPEGPSGALNIYELNIADGSINQLTHGPYCDQSPEITAKGVYFSSDREGTFNLFLLDKNGNLTRQSTYVTGAFDPRVTPDGQNLTYTGYQEMSFQIFEMELTPDPDTISQPAPLASNPWQPDKISSEFADASIKYDTDYSLDIAQSAIGYDPVYGSIGGVQIALSDILGNHIYHFLLTNTAETKDELLKSFNVGVTYINKEKQLNWGLGAFHLYDEYFNDIDQYYFERQVGVLSLFRYPISKFHRLDFTTSARYSNRELRFGRENRKTFLFTNYLSWVYDNSLWDISGPIDGRRYNFTVGLSTSLDEKRNYNRTAMADIRHYFRLGRYSAIANRTFGYTSSGVEPQRIYFGGSWSFRGFDRNEFYTRNVVFSSTELRFPLIDNLLIGFPIGNLGFSGIRGAIFFDVGSAWEDHYDGLIGSFGTGFRVAIDYLVVLRFDFSKTTDFETIDPGTDFDFFFGWNF